MQSATAMQLDFPSENEAVSDSLYAGTKSTARVTQPREVTLDGVGADTSLGLSLNYYTPISSPAHERSLIPLIIDDLLHNWYFYALCVCLCLLSLYKVYQVQETRTLTAELNEIALNNDDLSNEWLGLLAQKEELEKQAVIREAAVKRLHMVQPKTEAEIVIRLDR